MESITYDNGIVVKQKGRYPDVGDVVENVKNAEISIIMPNGNKSNFEVRDGVITKKKLGVNIANIIILVIFIVMMILSGYLIWLWQSV